ncbi:cytochrome P450 [Aspergillus filifer]
MPGGKKILITATLLNLLAWADYTVFIYPRFVSPLRNVPCTKGALPIIGHTLASLSDTRGEEALRICRETPNSGLIRLKGLFNSDQLLVTSPKALVEVLASRFLRIGIGDGLVVAEGVLHRHQRKHAMPRFAFRKIKDLYPLFLWKAVKMTQLIDEEAFSGGASESPSGVTDIDRWAPKATLDIIAVAGLGHDFNTLENSTDRIAVLYEHIFTPTDGARTVAACLVLFGVRLTRWLAPSASGRIFSAVDGIRELCHQFVKERREELKGTSHLAIGHFILLTLIAAGRGTTSATFTWAVYLLTLHADIQTRLALPIPTPTEPRGNNNDFDIAGTLESLPLLNGRWIDARTCKPNQTGSASTNYALLTFLHGSRSCTGQGFARAELRASLAAFVGAFEWTLAGDNEDVVPAIVVTVKPRDGLRVKLRRAR